MRREYCVATVREDHQDQLKAGFGLEIDIRDPIITKMTKAKITHDRIQLEYTNNYVEDTILA